MLAAFLHKGASPGIGATTLWADAKELPQIEVMSGPAEPLGTAGLCVNGVVHPHGRPTEWYVEYGPTAAYGMKSRLVQLPPKLLAFYHEAWDGNTGGWQGGMSGTDVAYHPVGGSSGGFLRFSEPSGNDPNHVDGIGTLHLCKYIYPGLLPGAHGTTMLAAGDPDLRNARVSLKVRGHNWVGNGSELVWWTQSQTNIEKMFAPEWRRANWAYTGYSLTPFLVSGKWESVEYRLLNDSRYWSYGGNNLAQNRPNYIYWAIDEAQQHLNNDFFHLLTFVDPTKLPQGSIDFDELIIAYHNESLLIPSNGGALIKSPADGGDASRLTDGWRHGSDKVWESHSNPVRPQEFVWKFDKPITLEAIQIHQHLRFPSKTVEVAISEDGEAWVALATVSLPKDSPMGPNYVYSVARPQPTKTGYVKVAIAAGYQVDRWGLGEIELFGSGATMLPEDEPTPVTVDLTELEPGMTCHYRLTAVSGGDLVHGEARSIQIPATTAPHVAALPVTRVTHSSARFEGRLNPMGKATHFWFEYGSDTSYGQRTEEKYGGLQVTPRLAAFEVSGLQPGMKYHCRLVARNETGTTNGPDVTFHTTVGK